MKIVFTLSFIASTFGSLTACRNRNAEKSSIRDASETRWQVTMLVAGDANCDSDRHPQPFETTIAVRNESVETLSSLSLESAQPFLDPPFSPDSQERAFLESIVNSPDTLRNQDARTKFEAVARKLFIEVFNPPVPTSVQIQILSNLGLTFVHINHEATIGDLLKYQTWWKQTALPLMNRHQLRNADASTEINLSLIGTVTQPVEPSTYKVGFDERDTIISGGGIGNLENQTTLCQLEKGLGLVRPGQTGALLIHEITHVKKR